MAEPPLRPLRDRAREVLALRATLLAEAERQRRQARTRETDSRRRQRRRRLHALRLAEQAAAAHVPWPMIDQARRRAQTLLGRADLVDLCSRAELADLETRLAEQIRTKGRQTVRAAYWAILPAPPALGPADAAGALMYYRAIIRTIEHGGWVTSERAALHTLARRWAARARGTDARFQIVGSGLRGRLPREIERQIAARKGHDD